MARLTCFSLGSLVVGEGSLTSGPSTSSVEGKLKRLSATAWTNLVPSSRHALTSSSLSILGSRQKIKKVTRKDQLLYEPKNQIYKGQSMLWKRTKQTLGEKMVSKVCPL